MNLVLPREDLAAGFLAAAVHGFFLLLLVLGVSWQIHDPQPIMAELWQALPAPMPAQPVTEPPPLPEAKAAPLPEPKPEPRPEPAPENKPADIALEKKKQEEALKKKRMEEARALEQEKLEKKKKLEQEKREQAALKQREEARAKLQREEDRLQELEAEREAGRIEMEKLQREQERKIVEQKRREALRQEEEALQRQMMEESLVSEASQIKAKAAATQRAMEIARIVELFKSRISEKVRGNTRLPDGLSGNPEAEFEVSVLPTGEITKVKLVKASSNPAYDREVQRGIEKSSPLPLPPDREAAAQFRNLILKHKAREAP